MQTSNKNKVIKNIIDGFQAQKGKMSFYCFDQEFIPEIIYNVIVPFHNKYPEQQIFIAVDCYDTRVTIMNYLKTKQVVSGENGFNIRILSKDFVKPQYHYNYKLIITVGINDDFVSIKHLYDESKFTMCILTKNIMNNEFITNVRNILPSINIENTAEVNAKARIYSPVEEHRVGVELSADDRKDYDKYTEYINTTLSILGSLYNIERCKKGDNKLNISGAEFRNNLAKENGWNENLDTNIPFMKQIDDIYNPNVIFERACTFYSIAKNRRDLVSDNEAKFEAIKDICLEHKDKKILIISKRAEYAAKVTNYLQQQMIACADYHDCLDNIFATNEETGNPVLIKSGANKGKPRRLGWQAQSSLNEKRFNAGVINVLSIKNASNVKLKIACDVVIFTSPLCDNIIDVKTRFANVTFNGVPTKTYKIYCAGTVESDKMIKDKVNPIIKVIDDTENLISYDKISGDIIL
jgi:hypothetical protein